MNDTPKRRRYALPVILCLCCLLLGGMGGWFAAKQAEKPLDQRLTDLEAALAETPAPDPAVVALTQRVTVLEDALAEAEDGPLTGPEIYALACRQAVGIRVEYSSVNLFGISTPGKAYGSGCVLSGDGLILTNYHIVEAAISPDGGDSAVTVLFSDGGSFPAVVEGAEPELDLAVLKIEAEGLDPIIPGDSGALRVGDGIFAIGNALGELAFTQTAGAVSALDREVNAEIGGQQVPIRVFQLDAAVNAGSSGGPVYNDRGQVVGIVFAKYSSSGVEGLGFAIPINGLLQAARGLTQ
jgi:serine protease Do